MTVPSGKMTLEKLAAMVAEGFDFMRNELRGEFRSEIKILSERIDVLSERTDFLEASTNAKFFALNNRIDDILDTRSKRDDLAATNVRVTRIEGHLGLA